jgi:hypothetical protein
MVAIVCHIPYDRAAQTLSAASYKIRGANSRTLDNVLN